MCKGLQPCVVEFSNSSVKAWVNFDRFIQDQKHMNSLMVEVLFRQPNMGSWYDWIDIDSIHSR